MTDMPERAWAFPPDVFDNMSVWQDQPSPNGDAVQYVRGDLYDTVTGSLNGMVLSRDEEIDALRAQLATARADALREAADWLDRLAADEVAYDAQERDLLRSQARSILALIDKETDT